MSARGHLALICECRGPRGIITCERSAPWDAGTSAVDEHELRESARRLGWRLVPIPLVGPDAPKPGMAWVLLCPDCAERAGLLTPERAPVIGSLTPRPVRHLAVHPDGTITR